MNRLPDSCPAKQWAGPALAVALAWAGPAASAIHPDESPWGVSASASSFRDHAEWFPQVAEAGIRWVRLYPEWRGIETGPGSWNWDAADTLVAAAGKHGLRINGVLMGSPPGARQVHAFPMDDLAGWSNFVAHATARHAGVIPHWEVWNEGNAGFNDGHHTTEDYARLVVATRDALRRASPDAQLGLSVASFDPAYLQHTVLALARMGRPDAFDTLCIHPYEVADGLADPQGEIPFLWMSHLLRDALRVSAPERKNAPIWITEFGRRLHKREEEPLAAQSLVKLHVMALAQGIARMEWFEARDPAGEEAGFGLIDRAGRARPSLIAYKNLIRVLGSHPRYIGWVQPGDKEAYGFVFAGTDGPVLAAWAPAGSRTLLKVQPGDSAAMLQARSDLSGTGDFDAAAGGFWLTGRPVLLGGLSPEAVAFARRNAEQPFPWGGDHRASRVVSCEPGAPEPASGVTQTGRSQTPVVRFADGTTGILVRGDQAVSFVVHPSFAGFHQREYHIRVTARRIAPGNVGMNLFYERADTQGGSPYRNTGTWFGLGKQDEWQTHTWKVTDACFAKMWGHDISLRPELSVPFVIGRVEVSTEPFPAGR